MSIDPQAVIGEAQRQAAEVMQQVLESMQVEPVAQEKLRAAFEQARYTQGGIEAFAAEFGEEEAVRQAVLALKRLREA